MTAAAMITLPSVMDSAVVSCADVLVEDAAAWAAALGGHPGHDVYVYAFAVTSTHIFLFYVIKCGIGGPTVRVAMVRTCLAAERVARCG
ncbi:hypothetical protein ACH4JS_36865 [Streptomyces sp. NPDC017638]|uniref:hypothetical protein n=1 Tax=Streptomyces sp. NPDC017638 TaxID=3365004 RepID=UPI00378ACB8D